MRKGSGVSTCGEGRLWAPGGKPLVVNGRFLGKPMSGVGRVGRELLRALTQAAAARGLGAIGVAAPVGVDTFGARLLQTPAGIAGEQLAMPRRWPDATFLSFCNTAPLAAARGIVFVHDAQVMDAPDTYSAPFRLWTHAIWAGIKARNFEIVAVSEFARERLIAHGAAPARVHVILNGADHLLRTPPEPQILAQHGLAGAPYVLVPGSPARLKNTPFAVAALSARLDPSIRIAVTGLHQPGAYEEAAAFAADPRVVRLPQVSDGALRALYANAACVVQPSLMEGFGLPPAEALFEGAPLALSHRASLPEVGGAAALYFDPTDADEIAARVAEAMTPAVSARLKAAGAAQKEKFRWSRAADELIALIEARFA